MRCALLDRDPLVIEADATAAPLVHSWLPLSAVPTNAAAGVHVRCDVAWKIAPPANAPLLRFGAVRAWRAGDSIQLHAPAAHGSIDLAQGQALLLLDSQCDTVHTLLTITCALLLLRSGRVLMHAAAVQHPNGGAILIPGDARSGKTTTTATLARAGWPWISDDQVVLDGLPPRVIGWPRPFHLDCGWQDGTPAHKRTPFPGTRLGPPIHSAPLRAVLLPRVHPPAPTRTTPAPASDALAALLRQAPWLLAIPHLAPAPFDLLSRVAQLPAAHLSLGLDCFNCPESLLRALQVNTAW